ncbi:MAG: tripartite tricarboxylate transporter permease [Spirochaetales bacterium]|nr:tripartite tricarboxylate transporter permease [Spirochaetales bacterium]
MSALQSLLTGFSIALSFKGILYCAIGAMMGLFIGSLPGMGAVTGIALLLPLTFKFEPAVGIIMLCSLYYANMYGGAYSAIILNIPGDSSAIMTTLDGYPMACRGQAGKAIMSANLASFIGGTIGMVILTFTGTWLARIGLKFGPAEMTSLLLLAMTSLGWAMGQDPYKGIAAAMFGLLLTAVGVGMGGSARLNFGSYSLLSGIPFVPLVIGMFGLSQVILMMPKRHERSKAATEVIHLRDSRLSEEEIKGIVPTSVRCGLIGTITGVLPGAGGTIANFFGYMLEKRVNRKGDRFGTGIVEGIAASESANNGCVGGALAPTLALGIPGSGATALLLGGLTMWGLTPGPMLYVKQHDLVWSVIASLYVANIICICVGTLLIPIMAKVSRVRSTILIPLITVICFLGAYSSERSMYGVVIMLAGACLGYIFNKFDWPSAPFLLAFVLGSTLEDKFRQAIVLGHGSPMIFIQKPISLLFIILLLICLIVPAVMGRRKKKVS